MDALIVRQPGKGHCIVELMPDAAAPALTRLRIEYVDRAEELVDLVLSTGHLEELVRLCEEHIARARPHDLAAIDAAITRGRGGQARAW
jgi:hypothetical protein